MTDAVDSVIAEIDPGLESPSIIRRDTVVVAGPWLAGTSGVVAALRDRLPERSVLEAGELPVGDAPAAVVFVVSATAPLAESDCALLDVVAADTDAVIGVVSKIDVHRTWRDVLDANRALLTERASRYGDMHWVGAAAAPDLGLPVVDDLVAALTAVLADETLDRRNRLRAWENRLVAVRRRLDCDVEGAGHEARLAALREQRGAQLRRFRLDKSERTIAARSQIHQARVQMAYFARARCASARAELQQEVATMTRHQIGGVIDDVRRRAAEVSGEVQQGTARCLANVGDQLGLAIEPPAQSGPVVEVGAAPLRSRSVESRLTMLLGAGFGLGIALTLSRLFADLAPQWAIGGAVGGAVLGLAAALWVVGVRGLLHDRALLDRWVTEVATGLRTAMEEWVATRVLAAEASLGRAAAERDAVEGAAIEEVVARIDAEIRAHRVQRARAAAIRDRRAPAIDRALLVVRAELNR
ncbi:hypothetical protein [Mycolicibacterium helvum]|uniref:Uncharacterized protein n=1 Tax=Mycolicibacterium helvum TaxID=1534349 RepID=A0A7I7T594_9MYCO|nr:hypothetical protein [Mycolicibacterium helvum]BBY63681.1 hypothetical protein MHEL_19240 [Mycolicibacterium helvum]